MNTSDIPREAARLRREHNYRPQDAQAMAELMAMLAGKFFCLDDVPAMPKEPT